MPEPRSTPILAVLAAAQFVVVLSTSIVNVALPAIRDGVGLSDGAMTWVINAYGLAFGALLLLGGRIADLRGRRPVLLAGLALFAAASLAAASAGGPGQLIAARTVQGVGAAAIAPAALSLVMQVFPPGPGRGKALGVWGAVSGAGGAAGVLLSGVLTAALGWRSVFYAGALGAALVLVAAVRSVPTFVPAGRGLRRIDAVGAVTVTVALVALVNALTLAGRSGWTDPRVAASGAVTAVLLAVFVRTERRHPAPLLPPSLLRTGSVAAANLLMGLLGAVWIGLFFFLPLYQQQVLGDGPLQAGLSQLPLAAANIVGSSLAPRLARRFGPVPTLAGALVLLAAGLAWLSGLSATGSFATDVLGPTLVIGLALGVAFVQLTAAAVARVPGADAGLASGLVNTTRQVGGAVGLAVLASLAASRTAASGLGHPHLVALTAGYRSAFLASAGVAVLAAALTPLLTRRPSSEHQAASTAQQFTPSIQENRS
ncbi:DHA2 family efflux MFS transporter permease subunit [Kitasatospora sp. CMC57]|uniref:DHA2 family efflux MFS transporter permease subunit n=1 Tax=Kitasatospora sp. CMC57 TaxID=3231513 RepID=A0AB33JVG0_9ACTN